MKTASMVLVSCMVFSTAGEAVSSPPEPDALPSGRVIDEWPSLTVSLGLLYSPAPYLVGSYNHVDTERKLLDQIGPRISVDWRLLDYMLLGGFVDIPANEGSLLFEIGIRAGAILPFNKAWCIYGLASVGVSRFDTEKPDHVVAWEKDLLGLHAGVTLGIRYLFHDHFGAFFEASGVLNRFQEMSQIAGEDHFPEPYLYRLEFVVGLLLDF